MSTMLVGKKVESGYHTVLPLSLALCTDLRYDNPIGLGKTYVAAETALAPWVGAGFPPNKTLKMMSHA